MRSVAVVALLALGVPANALATPAEGGATVTEVRTSGPLLGVQVTELSPELRAHFGSGSRGVLVSQVLPDTAAERAGVQVGDVIVEVSGADIASAAGLRRAVQARAGTEVVVELYRSGAPMELQAELPAAGAARHERRPSRIESDVRRLQDSIDAAGQDLEGHLDDVEEAVQRTVQDLEERVEELEDQLRSAEERLRRSEQQREEPEEPEGD